MQKSHELTSKKKIGLIVIVSVALGAALLVSDYVNTQKNFDQSIERNKAGLGIEKEQLSLYFLDNEETMEVKVSEQELTEQEVQEAFQQAIEEIESTYLGENTSPESVKYDLDVRESYVNGVIEANWKFDDYSIISMDGKINTNNVAEEGNIITAEVELTYSDEMEIYVFSFVVRPIGLETLDGQLRAINKAVEAADENTRSMEKMLLPQEAQGIKLLWKRKMDYRGLEIIILGIIGALVLAIAETKEVENRKKKYHSQLEADYPMIVNELSILMGAGMSLRGALERISRHYVERVMKNEKYRGAGYEEILMTYRQLCDGVGEIAAIENMAKRTEHKDYRRLAMLLVQNIKKGSKDLLSALESEESSSFDARKQRALRLGEEASTKLLLPMGGMLMIVLVILIVPAAMNMNF